MDRETRVAWLVDHQRRPRHQGPMADADVSVEGGNPDCGDLVTMYLRVEPESDRVAAVSFEGTGCTLSQAAASILAVQVNRRRPTLEEITQMSYEQVLDELGRDITVHRPRCATLALGTLKAAVAKLARNRRLKAAGRTDEEIRALRVGLSAVSVAPPEVERA